jgi:hypothetical protein
VPFRGDIWEEARRLVVEEGWEYARVATELGLALSTLQKHAAQEKWREQRKAAMGYRAQVRAFKALTLKDTLAAWEAAKTTAEKVQALQLLHGWKALEQAFPERHYPEPEEPEANELAEKTDEELMEIIARRAR